MSETLVRFTETIAGRDGRVYVASACGVQGKDGLWHGWIEFSDGRVPLRTTEESEQPNRDDLMYWAQGLTYVYLEGALERALRPTGEYFAVRRAASMQPNAQPAAVLDPYSVYRQGEDVLRRQLLALSRDQLNAVIEQYRLGTAVPPGPRGMTGYVDDVERILIHVRSAAAGRPENSPEAPPL